MKTLLTLTLCLLLGACASNITVRMPAPSSSTSAAPLAQVKVNDLRAPGVAASTREAAFGVPMGNISFDPPEAQQIKRLLEAELSRRLRERGVTVTQDFVCDIVEFGVNTRTTPLYWDVVGRVRLQVRQGGREFSLSGTGNERTFVWPGEELIARVISNALGQIAAEIGSAVASR